MQLTKTTQESSPDELADPAWRRDNAMVWHRLCGGAVTVHAPAQPCTLCGGGPRAVRPITEALTSDGTILRW